MSDFSAVGDRIWDPPIGWYRVGEAPPAGHTVRTDLGPLDPIVVWRGLDGELRAAHGICPHLGADLSLGGTCDADGSLTCPFHGWRFGSDGGHLDTPQGKRVPNARLLMVPVHEVDGDALVFHGGAAEVAPWPPAASAGGTSDPSDGTASSLRRITDSAIGAPPVILAEGAFDLAHFSVVHGVEPAQVEYRFDGPVASIEFGVAESSRPVRFRFGFDGLTRLTEEVVRGRYRLRRDFSLYWTAESWRSHVVASITGPSAKAAAHLLDQLESLAGENLALDAALWEHRQFAHPSVYGPADRTLREFRTWSLQFMELVGSPTSQTAAPAT